MLQEQSEKFSKSCKSVQTCFSGYDSYKSYFEPLLFAELAADLAAVTDKYCRSSKLRNKHRIRREEPGTTLVKVLVKNVFPNKTFGWSVDLEPTDKKGPVGCGDSDIVALWNVDRQSAANAASSNQKRIPNSAVLASVVRSAGKLGVRINLSQFPDGDPNRRQELEEGEESEVVAKPRHWFLLRLGTTVTIRREHEAVLNIKNSPLLSVLLKPSVEPSAADVPLSQSKEQEEGGSAKVTEKPAVPQREHQFTQVVRYKMVLNESQATAVLRGSTTVGGFTVIQGPPGTGKTRTLIALLNVVHMSQYQEYYEKIVAKLKTLRPSGQKQSGSQLQVQSEKAKSASSKNTGKEGSLLESLVSAMTKTFASVNQGIDRQNLSPARRPRILVCAPSNSAVDEILARLIKLRLFDGQGNSYLPEVVRIGAGARVNESAKPFTAEGQAEKFLNAVCAEDMSQEEQRKAQQEFLQDWQHQVNSLLLQLERVPKSDANMSKVIGFHEDLERADRNLRRLRIAADRKLSRDDKLRKIARTIVEDANIVFSTLSGAASNILARDQPDSAGLFDTVIIDEAAQSTEPSCLVPLMLGAKRCLLIGDPQQLPATVLSSGNAGNAYGQSLLDRVCRAGKKVLLLNKQYRMHPAISAFPRRYFYEGNLLDDETVVGDNRLKPYHRDEFAPRLGPYVFLDVADGEEERNEKSRSIFNRAEAELAVMIYKKLKNDYGDDGIFSAKGRAPGSSVGFGVVTPYKSQMQELRQAFDRAGIAQGDIEIDTVDSYQGREKDVIIFSCVRSAVNRGIGFVRDVRRMNVGLTRARSSLIILGSARALSEGSEDWAALIEDAQSRGCLISVPEIETVFGGKAPEKPQKKECSESQQYAPPSRDPRMRYSGKQEVRSVGNAPHTGNVHRTSTVAATLDTAASGANAAEVIERKQAHLKQLIDFLNTQGVTLTEKTVNTLQQHIGTGGEMSMETFLAAGIATGEIKIKDPAAVPNLLDGFSFQAPVAAAENAGVAHRNAGVLSSGDNGSLNAKGNGQENRIPVPLRSMPAGQRHNKNVRKAEPEITARPDLVNGGQNDATGWAMALGGGSSSRDGQGSHQVPEGAVVNMPVAMAGMGGGPGNGKRSAAMALNNGEAVYDGAENMHEQVPVDHQSVMGNRNQHSKRPRFNGDHGADPQAQYYGGGGGNGYNGVPDQSPQDMRYDPANQQHYGQEGYGNAMMPQMGMQNAYFSSNMPYAPPPPPGQPQGLAGPAALQQHSMMMQQMQQAAAMHGMMPQAHPGVPPGMQMPFFMAPNAPPMANMMQMAAPLYGQQMGMPGVGGGDGSQFNNHGRGGHSWRGRGGGGRYGRGRNTRGRRRGG